MAKWGKSTGRWWASRPEIGLWHAAKQRKRAEKRAGNPVPRDSTYCQRTEVLLSLGFRTYQHYLQSKLWARLRSSAFMLARGKCKLCGSRPDVIHHVSYSRDTLLGNEMDNLAAVCRACHKKVEFADDGSKRSLADAQAVFNSLLPRGS